MTEKIEYNQAGTVLTMYCDDGSVKVFDRKAVMSTQPWRSKSAYVWELRTMAQYPRPIETVIVDDPLKTETITSARALAAARWWYRHGGHWTKDRDNAAKTWYYETYTKPRLKKEFE